MLLFPSSKTYQNAPACECLHRSRHVNCELHTWCERQFARQHATNSQCVALRVTSAQWRYQSTFRATAQSVL